MATKDSSMHVVALGDSLAYGAGDETDGGIPGRLKKELDRLRVGATTTNLGVNGATTSDLIARLRQQRVRGEVEKADAIVLSIGANDLFRGPGGREESMRNPFGVAARILDRISEIVAALHRINPEARILILGGYNPVPGHVMTPLIEKYLVIWDGTLSDRFASEDRVAIVKIADIIDRPDRLSRYDYFHPGGAAYAEAAKRIATMLVDADDLDERRAG